MRVVSLKTLGFRNLAPAEVELGEGITLLHGANGAGKTNLLEALYMGLAGRSCRTRADRETIAFGEALSRSEVVIEDSGEPLEIAFNPQFLIEGIETVETDEISVQISSPLRPGLLRPVGSEDFSYLVMPIRLNV